MNKRGFLSVEVAIFLPIFLLALLTLISVIRMVGVEENVMKAFKEEAMEVSKEAYVTQLEMVPEEIGLVNEIILQKRLESHIQETEEISLDNLHLRNFRYLYNHNQIDSLIRGSLVYTIDLPLPAGFNRSIVLEQRLLFRGFTGSNKTYNSMGFEIMEHEQDSVIVYIFPRAGERYHNKGCRLIATYPEEIFLSAVIRKNYRPCKNCDAKTISEGSKVYIFTKSGEVYHRGNCTSVDRYIVPIEKIDAIKDGYTACNICGG